MIPAPVPKTKTAIATAWKIMTVRNEKVSTTALCCAASGIVSSHQGLSRLLDLHNTPSFDTARGFLRFPRSAQSDRAPGARPFAHRELALSSL